MTCGAFSLTTGGSMNARCEWARALALQLMTQFGLADWDFAFNRRKRRLGQCVFPTKDRPGRIELSVHWVELAPPEDLEDTIRHEIAHALAGPLAMHGPVWIAMCKVTGARPNRCNHHKLMPKGAWRAKCP